VSLSKMKLVSQIKSCHKDVLSYSISLSSLQKVKRKKAGCLDRVFILDLFSFLIHKHNALYTLFRESLMYSMDVLAKIRFCKQRLSVCTS
jgi:hypothetical protein